jgi:tetratricopeptide (TPR) repeat protein
MAIGDPGKARDYAQAAGKIADGLLAADPRRFDASLLRAQSRMILADATFWDGGDAKEVKSLFASAIDEYLSLVESKPDGDALEENLAYSYENYGDAFRTMGDFDGAASAYAQLRDLAEKRAQKAADSSRADFWRAYGAEAYMRLGDVSRQQKKFAGEVSNYRRGVELAAAISARHPDNTKYIEDLTLARGRLSDALVAGGRLPEANEEIDQSVDLANKLVADFSANIRWLIYQEWAHLRKGRALMAAGDYAQAYDQFSIYLHGVAGMLQRDPKYYSAYYDQSNAHQWRGDALRMQKELPEAQAEYGLARQSAVEAVRLNPPSNQAARKILAMAEYRLGVAAEGQERKDEAIRRYRACADIAFNRDVWTPRSDVPDDVTQACRDKLKDLGAPP